MLQLNRPAPGTAAAPTPAHPLEGTTDGEDHPTDAQHVGHGHGPPAPADRRVRLAIAALLVPCALATLIGLLVLYPSERPVAGSGSARSVRLAGHVTAAVETTCNEDSAASSCLALTVRMQEGPLANRDVVVLESAVHGQADFSTGDDVLLITGEDPADPVGYQIVDHQRGTPLLALALVFAAAVVRLARWRGVAALVALGMTAVVLVAFMLPAILAGRDPLAVAVVGSCAIMFAAL